MVKYKLHFPGDVPPHDGARLYEALYSGASGVQVDFDDGSCPTWRNVLLGHFNIFEASRGLLSAASSVRKRSDRAAIMMVRPRAWNMKERHVRVQGVAVPGAIFDFAVHMYHNAQSLLARGLGPFLYCSKVECYEEALLWDSIITWTEHRLSLPFGCTKVCVLIENITASFQMEEILYALRHHAIGLNCGIWDYSASFAARFGTRPAFVFPDRSKYVSMSSHFMQSYMKLLVHTCHKHGALATTGMAAAVLSNPSRCLSDDELLRNHALLVQKVVDAKLMEADAGADGALVYDPVLVKPVLDVFSCAFPQVAGVRATNQIALGLVSPIPVFARGLQYPNVTANDLLSVPPGNVTGVGLRLNIEVGVNFIFNWLQGRGSFILNGLAEDSATAEISRSQVWQWIRFNVPVVHSPSVKSEFEPSHVTATAVQTLVNVVCEALYLRLVEALASSTEAGTSVHLPYHRRQVELSGRIFMDLVTSVGFPTFVTTLLYDSAIYWDGVASDQRAGRLLTLTHPHSAL